MLPMNSIRNARSFFSQMLMKTILVAATLAPAFGQADDDDSDIVTGCLLSNAEFGTEMAQICIRENLEARAEVARYPEEVKDIVANCSRRKLAGWGVVKKCIDDDIAAAPVLERFAQEHAQVLAQCQEQFRGREAARIRNCVETAHAAEGAGAKR